MKVAIASTLSRNCGIGQYTEHLTKCLSTKVDQIITLRKGDADNEHFLTYPYRSFRSLQHHVAPYYLHKAVKKLQADIWHADSVGAYLALEWAKVKCPKIVTAHDAIPFYYSGKKSDFLVYKYQLKQAVKHAKYLIVVSEAAKQDFISKTGIDASRVIAIPNGLNLTEFNHIEKAKENEVFTIRYLGGLGAKHKNVSLLLNTASILEEKGVIFKMELGGYIPENFFLKDLARSLKLTSVSFPGFIADEDKPQFLADADLFAYPSLMEGFGFPPMEAMASGTAVLATNIPVFKELLGDSAYLTSPTPQAFADAILDLMQSRDRKEELAELGKNHVKQYTWEKAAELTLEVYQKAMA